MDRNELDYTGWINDSFGYMNIAPNYKMSIDGIAIAEKNKDISAEINKKAKSNLIFTEADIREINSTAESNHKNKIENYYNSLNLNHNASEQSIKKAVSEEKKKWENTNDEVHKVYCLDEIQDTLLEEINKKNKLNMCDATAKSNIDLKHKIREKLIKAGEKRISKKQGLNNSCGMKI